MARFRKALAKIAKALKLNHALLARAQRRYKVNRRRAYVAHNQQLKAQKRADDCRRTTAEGGYPNTRVAERFDREARRHAHVAYRNHLRAQHYLGVVKKLQQRIHGLETRHDKLEADARKWRTTHGVQIHGNTVTGGNPGQRWRAALLASVANCANGKRRNFYSMSGGWDVDHVITPGEAYGERSDCSSTVTGWAKACGLPDPNGEDFHAGYTGTLVGEHNGWRQVSRAEMERSGKPGYIVYGPGVGHHTEAFLGHGVTCGHGSAPVDKGVVDLFGDGDYRCYILNSKE